MKSLQSIIFILLLLTGAPAHSDPQASEPIYQIDRSRILPGLSALWISNGFSLGAGIPLSSPQQPAPGSTVVDLISSLQRFQTRVKYSIEFSNAGAYHRLGNSRYILAGATGSQEIQPSPSVITPAGQANLIEWMKCSSSSLAHLKQWLVAERQSNSEIQAQIQSEYFLPFQTSEGGSLCGIHLKNADFPAPPLIETVKMMAALQKRSLSDAKTIIWSLLPFYHPNSPVFQNPVWAKISRALLIQAAFNNDPVPDLEELYQKIKTQNVSLFQTSTTSTQNSTSSGTVPIRTTFHIASTTHMSSDSIFEKGIEFSKRLIP
jgi:hypothetical protein